MTQDEAIRSFSPVQTWLPPWGLMACVRAVIRRSTVGVALSGTDLWGHYPAGPVCAISCLLEGTAEMLAAGCGADPHAPRQSVPVLAVTGPHSVPRNILYGPEVDGVMVILYPDAWWALTGIAPETLSNQLVDAHCVLPPDLLEVFLRMRQGGDADSRVQTFFEGIQTLWKVQGHDRLIPATPPRQWAPTITPWMESMALRAATTGWGRSLRQSERRIKQWTGWSLRKLQGSARGEDAFFAVMEAMLEERLDWAQIALDNGFSDQSHFIRETRRITGFSPEALRHGYLHEEAFWIYRAWAQLAGYQVPVHSSRVD
jgi:hypothetical protein